MSNIYVTCNRPHVDTVFKWANDSLSRHVRWSLPDDVFLYALYPSSLLSSIEINTAKSAVSIVAFSGPLPRFTNSTNPISFFLPFKVNTSLDRLALSYIHLRLSPWVPIKSDWKNARACVCGHAQIMTPQRKHFTHLLIHTKICYKTTLLNHIVWHFFAKWCWIHCVIHFRFVTDRSS